MSQSCSTTCKPQLSRLNFWHYWKVFCLVLSEMLNIMHLRIKDSRMPSRGMLQNPAYVIVIPRGGLPYETDRDAHQKF